jgi:hypothetical protein
VKSCSPFGIVLLACGDPAGQDGGKRIFFFAFSPVSYLAILVVTGAASLSEVVRIISDLIKVSQINFGSDNNSGC